jgi:cell cycle sensor histidine kinase DivJ
VTSVPDPPEPDLASAARERELLPALRQHLAFSGAVLATLVGLFFLTHLSARVAAALFCGAVPGLAAQLLRRHDSGRRRWAVLGAWTVGGALAASLTGGLAGPLAAWCAAPLAAGIAFDRRNLVSGGAHLSLAALAFALWASASRFTAPPPMEVGLWLGALSVTSTAAWIAAALSRSLGRRDHRADAASGTAGRLETLLAEQPHLILTLDTGGKVGSAFGAAIPGVPVEALFAQGLIAQTHHPDRPALQTALYRAATHGQAEARFSPRTALDRHLTLDLRRMDDGRLIGVLRDSSLQHAREAALEAARSEAEALNAGKSRFLANMSHELRTPLNAVLGFSDIMRQRLFGPLPERYAEYAQLIHESGGHLLDLINDVLDMSKIEAARYELRKEIFDAREPVSAALRLVRGQAHEAEVTLRGVLPAEAVVVEADHRAIKQIVLNLMSNALKFTPATGSVTVSLAADGGAIEIVVADTGVGVAPEDLARLGRPFEQAGDAGSRSLGTGLGLSLVRALAELHGGRMSIESTLGEGTAVTVRLPVIVDQQDPRRGAEIISIDARR